MRGGARPGRTLSTARRRAALLLPLVLALAAAPAASDSVASRNALHFWTLLGDVDPETPATMHDGRVLPLRDVVAEAVVRAGGAELGSLQDGGPGGGVRRYLGDVWVLSMGPGPCTTTRTVPQPVRLAAQAQTVLYSGHVATMAATSYHLEVTSWTLKLVDRFETTPWQIAGVSDTFCAHFAGQHFAFPFSDGLVTVGPPPPEKPEERSG